MKKHQAKLDLFSGGNNALFLDKTIYFNLNYISKSAYVWSIIVCHFNDIGLFLCKMKKKLLARC